MERKTKLAVIGSAAAVLIIAVALISVIVERLTPSKEVMELTDYYKVKDSEVIVILQDEVYKENGLLVNNKVYIDYDTVVSKFNKRFYWDSNENILTYTTPTQILRVKADKEEYTQTKSTIETKVDTNDPIVKIYSGKVYISLDFVKKYSNLTYQYYHNPNRIVVHYIWGNYLYSDVDKATQLRCQASIKSPVLLQMEPGTKLLYVDKEEAPKHGFVKVMTSDGIRGYIKKSCLKKAYYKKLKSSYQAPKYTSQTRSGKINMVFHQVFNTSAAGNLDGLIAATKDVNVVAPTWFSISNETGRISSLATEEYVKNAERLGLEVWALVDDFNKDVDMKKLLSHTSRRDTLSNLLIQEALKYKLNGINIDFENITSEAGKDYIEFIRELSVKCRNNGIVLSIDSYVPSNFSKYYDREEQGKVADYVVVMAYDEHYAGSETAGPVSSIGYVKDAVKNILTMVPKKKTIIAIPFYTRLWKEKDKKVTSQTYAMEPAKQLIKDNNLETKWDDADGCYYIEYQKDGATYRMWQEEEKSIEEKMKVIYNADTAGSAYWKLGIETKSIWNVIERYIN